VDSGAIPVDSSGMAPFLQESVGQGKVLQPGVNLPDNWNENPNHPDNWKYTRGFVADGNFTAVHQKQA